MFADKTRQLLSLSQSLQIGASVAKKYRPFQMEYACPGGHPPGNFPHTLSQSFAKIRSHLDPIWIIPLCLHIQGEQKYKVCYAPAIYDYIFL